MKSEIVVKRYPEVGEVARKCEHLNDLVKPIVDKIKEGIFYLEGVEYGHVQNSLFPEKHKCYALSIGEYFRGKNVGVFTILLLETDKERIKQNSFSGIFDINFFIVAPETKLKDNPELESRDIFNNEDCDTVFLFNSNANSTLKSIFETVLEAAVACIRKKDGKMKYTSTNGTLAKAVPMVNAFNVLSGGATDVTPEIMDDIPFGEVLTLSKNNVAQTEDT